MIKLETHCHSKGGSGCAMVEPKQLVAEYVAAGYGGIVLTNHYCEVCYKDYIGKSHKEKLDFYFSLFDNVKEEGKKQGLKVFLGAEVRAVTPVGTYSEFMLYGIDKKLFYDNEPLFHLTQKEMFEFSNKHGIFMYQTHPFREGVNVGNPKFMHGAEAFNGHVNHVNNNALAEKFCKENNLIRMSGTDYHDPNQLKTGGIYIPEEINDEKALKEYVASGKAEIIINEDLYQKNLRAKKK